MKEIKGLYRLVIGIEKAGRLAAKALSPILDDLVEKWELTEDGRAVAKPKDANAARILAFELAVRPGLISAWTEEHHFPSECGKDASKKEKDARAVAVLLWKVERARFSSNVSYLKRAAGLTAAGKRRRAGRKTKETESGGGAGTVGADSVIIPEAVGKTPSAENALIRQVVTALSVRLGVSVEKTITRIMAVYSAAASK